MPETQLNPSHHTRARYGAPCLLLAIVVGAVHSLSFAPDPLPAWALPVVQLFAMAVLIVLVWRAASLLRAACLGLCFGLGHFSLGLYWLHISIHMHGGVAWLPAALAVLLLALFESLFTLGASGLAWWLGQRNRSTPLAGLHAACAWASSWVLWEWLRGTLLTGFPWLNVAYAHIDSPFSGWASVAGVYGVAWFAAFAAATLAWLARTDRVDANTRLPLALYCMLSVVAGIGFSHIRWGTAHGSPLQVRLVQGNIPQSDKFDPVLLRQSLAYYRQLAARPYAGGAPDVIVLPETVIPVLQDKLDTNEWQAWLALAQAQHTTLMLGVPLHTTRDTRHVYTNSVIAFDPSTPLAALHDGSVPMRYDKAHLVPFGEYIPAGFRWFVQAMSIPLGDFDRGSLPQQQFPIADQQLAPNICYEDVFGEEIRHAVKADATRPGATVLVNFSNLGWFGDSWALRQHLVMARMRSIETHRPMLRATNTGMTAAIAPDGRVQALLPAQQAGVLDVSVQGMTGLTPYVRLGNAPVLLWLMLSLAGVFWLRRVQS